LPQTSDALQIGINAPWALPDYGRGLRSRRDAGLELVIVSDHISFLDGSGQDGLIRAGMVHALEPSLQVFVCVYLLGLRHPTAVARQMAELELMAPGKLILGVGVGGEDRNEIRACGVDPRSRGARTNEALVCLRRLLSGEPVDYDGRHFSLDRVRITPAVDPAPPILVGGRSEKALERTARHGDGWFGIFCSVERFAQSLDKIAEQAEAQGRPQQDWHHGMQFWCCVDNDAKAARPRLAATMESFYGIPFEKFEHYCPAGPAEYVAELIAGYVRAGARIVNLTPVAEEEQAVADAAAVRAHLIKEFGPD
jgi:alkanesulfonate monooxygenase SsuD/methylene tetrahydromethanopterin reductase-like flavin-dependent oxidoreductase (luciferase family)